jgi:hypothetical protein
VRVRVARIPAQARPLPEVRKRGDVGSDAHEFFGVITWTMQNQKDLTEPQTRLLLKLHAKPAQIHKDYRPLKPLIERDRVRVRHVGQWGSNPLYELSESGAKLAQQIKEQDAAQGRECTCGRQWSLKHEPQCPAAARRSPA